jgi:transcriptional regulator with XRE-family HTH domain
VDAEGEDNLPLGRALQLCRTRANVSARNLSLAAGLSESYVGKVEKGEIEPSLRAFARIAKQLGMSPREIYVLVIREAARS